ncbi:hypothetical protein ASH00_16165 [Arthrobacter sp. Soil782]|uniref:hypothetical protein n=1 Tax=Arthrobacter sp. Soil782 TaxID=1736410 RepID=UPI0006FCD85D|nr:hypothetical protein [Arthrobacter sp. Soil782]KRF07078.1 hypothetical protein ASH00_16165 [Arthrobacter sp. Soil782]
MKQSMVAVASDSPAIGAVIGFVILILLVAGVVTRLIVVLARRGGSGAKRDVAGPIVDSGGVQSGLYGYPSEHQDMKPEDPRMK